MAFLIPERLPFTAEYDPHFLYVEITGHILFGLVAGAFSGDLLAAVLSGLLASVIDADHMASVFIAPVLDRTAHSVFFALVSSLLLAYITRRKGTKLNFGVAVIVWASILSHLSYDTLLRNGNFPILAPLSFNTFSFPDWFWLPFEMAAILLNLVYFQLLARERSRLRTEDRTGRSTDK